MYQESHLEELHEVHAAGTATRARAGDLAADADHSGKRRASAEKACRGAVKVRILVYKERRLLF